MEHDLMRWLTWWPVNSHLAPQHCVQAASLQHQAEQALTTFEPRPLWQQLFVRSNISRQGPERRFCCHEFYGWFTTTDGKV